MMGCGTLFTPSPVPKFIKRREWGAGKAPQPPPVENNFTAAKAAE